MTFRFPPLKGNVLVVGDGDFAYSVALARRNQTHGSARIFVSSLDLKCVVERKYPRAQDHLRRLSSYANVTVVHGLDATKPTAWFNRGLWDSIIWNFPYCPDKAQASSEEVRDHFNKFFRNTSSSLKCDGAFYMTLSKGSASSKLWNFQKVVFDAGLEVAQIMNFSPSDISGYRPKFSIRDEDISYKDCRAYVLQNVCISQKINDLLLENRGQVSLSQFKILFVQRYGKEPFPNGGKLKKNLESLSNNAGFFVTGGSIIM